MNTMLQNKMRAILSFAIIVLYPFMALGADMWSETPDVSHDSMTASIAVKPDGFSNTSPTIDIWAETPDLQANEEYHGVIVDSDFNFEAPFIPEMYSETPDLNAIPTIWVSKQREKTLIADE